MSDILQSLSCPSCGGTPLTDKGNGTISCSYCGAAFAHPDRVCPYCEAINELDVRHCASCGEKLREPCARCGALNLVQTPYCRQCGSALDVLEHIAARRAVSTAERITHLQASMTPLKEEAERASQERLEKMWAKDHARMETLARAKAEQERQERLLWIVAAAAIVALVIGIVVLTVMAQFRAH